MPKTIKMGNWLVFPDNNKLCLNDTNYFIEPLAMDVLVYFAEHSEQVISRDELIEAVWKGRIVGDHAVYRIINKLRQTLAKDASQEYIKTIRKKGYQLVCVVEQLLKEPIVSSVPTEDSSDAKSDLLGSALVEQEIAGKEKQDSTTKQIVTEKNLSQGKSKKGWLKVWRWVLIVTLLLVGSFLSVKLYFYYSMTGYYHSTPLITMSGTIRDPSFSPDGDYIVFSYQESMEDDWDIYIESLTNGRFYQITNDVTDELNPTWLPDSRQIAILRYDNQRCMIDLLPMSLPTSKQEKLNDQTMDSLVGAKLNTSTVAECSGVLQHNDLVWGLDNKYLYYTSAKTKVSPLQIFRLTIQTGKTEQLTNYTQGETRGALAIKLSPDNGRLAVLRDVNWRDSRIDILDLETGEFQTVRHLVGWNRYFDWSKDGQTLIYNRNTKEIDAYHVAMNIEKNIAKSVEAISYPTYSPKRSEMAVVAGRKVVNIVAESLGMHPKLEEKPLTVISSSSIDNYAEYANTSDTIAFVSRRTGEPQVWMKDTDGSEHQLTYFEGSFDIQRVRWSPSDQSLIFIHGNKLYRLELKNKSLDVLYEATEGETIEGESWGSDERSVLFSSDRDGDWQVYQLDLMQGEDKAVKQLTQKGGYAAFDAPQKGGIFYLKYHTKGLWFKPYDSDSESVVVNNIDVFSWNSIYLRQNSLYYLSDDFPKMKVYRYDFDSEQTYFVQNYYGSPWLLSISHQADKLLYQRNTQTQSSLVLLKP